MLSFRVNMILEGDGEFSLFVGLFLFVMVLLVCVFFEKGVTYNSNDTLDYGCCLEIKIVLAAANPCGYTLTVRKTFKVSVKT